LVVFRAHEIPRLANIVTRTDENCEGYLDDRSPKPVMGEKTGQLAMPDVLRSEANTKECISITLESQR
jgi:hypothetical protein